MTRKTGTCNGTSLVSCRAFRDHAAFLLGHPSRPFSAVALVPPSPWNQINISPDIKLDLSEAAAAATLSAAEIYWDAVAIDPNVIVAADFTQCQPRRPRCPSPGRRMISFPIGAGYSFRGYTAKRLVRDHFVALGHSATMARQQYRRLGSDAGGPAGEGETPSQPVPACNAPDKYPDIPVIANLKLADKFGQAVQTRLLRPRPFRALRSPASRLTCRRHSTMPPRSLTPERSRLRCIWACCGAGWRSGAARSRWAICLSVW